MHSKNYINTLVKKAQEKGIFIIVDEVAVGFGRTGTLFATEQLDFEPDFLCLAKGISGGYLPLAATLTTEAIYDAFLGLPEEGKQFFHGHTYTGNPLACAVSLASLDLFRTENVLAHVAQLTTVFSTALAALERTPWIRHTRQCGVMIGIDLCAPDGSDAPPQTGHKVSMIARSLGAVFRPLGNTIVLNPPLSLTTTEAERLIEITREASRHVLEDLT